MKNMKRLSLLFLILSVTLTFFACGGRCEHADENRDGTCDKCGKEIITEEARVLLFDNGEPTFQIVTEKGLDRGVRDLINEFIDEMDDLGYEIKAVTGTADNETECEILIGNVDHRDEKFFYDVHTLGKEGYIFKIIDGKVLINAGSDEMLEGAIEAFIEEVLFPDGMEEVHGTLYMTSAEEVLIKQEYDITALKLAGKDMRGYTIAANMQNSTYAAAARALQDAIYDKTGYWLETVSLDKADRSIVIKQADRIYGENSFRVYENGEDKLIIECSFDNKLADAVTEFAVSKIALVKEGEINLSGDVFKKDISFLTYEEFGAVGNGRTNDFEALYKTHIAANQYKQTVKAKDGAEYYIKETLVNEGGTMAVREIPIKTNVVWGKAKFIIDDHDISAMERGSLIYQMSQNDIFEIQSDYAERKIKDDSVLDALIEDGLKPGVTKLNLSFDYPALLIPYDSTHTVYRRKGYGSAQGAKMHEVIIIDKDGNIDPSTPIMFTYLHLDEIEVHRLDIEPITVEGGIFTTRATRVNTLYTNAEGELDCNSSYLSRGIDCRRSFTTVKNVEHYVTNEITLDEQIENGNTVFVPGPYMGFYSSAKATEITYDGCVMTGRRCYERPKGCVKTGTSGTYDLYGDEVNKLVFKNCTQSNFWITVDEASATIRPSTRNAADSVTSMSSYTWDGMTVKMHWGIGGTNFCKNMEYIDSTLSRFDAHAGLYNGKIIGCTVNYMALTGNGEFIVKDTEWYSEGTGGNSASLFHLRADYGSTWEGEIIAENIKAYVHTDGASYLFLHTYNNWYYGYTSCMPSLSLDNLDVYDIDSFEPVDAGYEIMMLQVSLRDEPQMHLSETFKTAAIYCYIDLDEDGFVDGTALPYDETLKTKYENGVTLDSADPASKKNLNRIQAPEYLKILNNDGAEGAGGYKFVVYDTYGTAKAVDPGATLPDGVDPDGGFFAATKFYYSEDEFFLGTNHASNGTFKFEKY